MRIDSEVSGDGEWRPARRWDRSADDAGGERCGQTEAAPRDWPIREKSSANRSISDEMSTTRPLLLTTTDGSTLSSARLLVHAGLSAHLCVTEQISEIVQKTNISFNNR